MRGGRAFFDFGVSAERHSVVFSPSKCLASAAISLIYYVFPWIGGGIFCFHPQHVAIINSSLIPLCWLHVRPYLPLNTLSPISIFQISDTICGIQMRLSLSASFPPSYLPSPCERPPALRSSRLGANCALLNLFVRHLIFAGTNTCAPHAW